MLTKLPVNLFVEVAVVKAIAEFLINVNVMQDTLATIAHNGALMTSGVKNAAMNANATITQFVTIGLAYAIALLDGLVICKIE